MKNLILCLCFLGISFGLLAQDEENSQVNLDEEIVEEIIEPPKEKTWRKTEYVPYILSYPYPKNGYENLTQKLEEVLKLESSLKSLEKVDFQVIFKVQEDGSCEDYEMHNTSKAYKENTLVFSTLKQIIDAEKWFPIFDTSGGVETHISHYIQVQFDTKKQKFRINTHCYASHFVPKNGFQKLLDELQAEIKYSEKLIEYGIHGRVHFHCKMTETGKIQETKLISGFPLFDEEAERVFKKIISKPEYQNWDVLKYNDSICSYDLYIPIAFDPPEKKQKNTV